MEGLGNQINNIDEGELLAGGNQALVLAIEDDNAPAPALRSMGQCTGLLYSLVSC
jgi:hypothetical protein